jgi:hypothetical protein
MRVDLQSTKGGYFISCESALGVITGWRTLMGIPNGRVFSLNAKGFSSKQCSRFPNEDFLRILRQGNKSLCVFGSDKSSRMRSK